MDGAVFENVTLAGIVTSRSYSGLDHLKTYSFSVYAVNDAGRGTQAGTAVAQPAILPTAPVGLVASVDSPLQIRLRWSYPADTGRGATTEALTTFLVERADSDTMIASVTVSDDLVSCTASTCDQRVTFTAFRKAPYYFRVRARNFLGLGSASIASEQSVALPTAPLSPTATVTGPLTVLVSWASPASSGVGDLTRTLLSYMLEVNQGDGSFAAATTSQTVLGASNYSKIVTFAAASSTAYYFRVLAANDAGSGPASVTVSEQSVAPPTAPLGVMSVINGPLSHYITWSPPADTGVGGQTRPLIAQRIEIKAESGGSTASAFAPPLFLDLTALGPTTQSYNITSLVQGKVYFVRVTATNMAGTGPASLIAYQEAVALPQPPGSFVAAVDSEMTIKLSWAVPADTGFLQQDIGRVTTFWLEQSTESNFVTVTGNLLASPLTPTALSRVVTPLAKGTRFYFRIYTYNIAGRSSTYSTANEQSISVANAPVIAASITAELQVTFSWTVPTDTGLGAGVLPQRPLTGYVLEITEEPTPPATNPSFSTIYASYNESSAATFRAVSGLNKGNTYFARVLARNDAGSGVPSATADRQAITRPASATITRASPNAALSLVVTWIAPIDSGLGVGVAPAYALGNYRLQYAQDAAFTSDAVSVSLGSNFLAYQITGLVAGRYYFVRVFASNSLGESVSSGAI